jgi:hypothetical protein
MQEDKLTNTIVQLDPYNMPFTIGLGLKSLHIKRFVL